MTLEQISLVVGIVAAVGSPWVAGAYYLGRFQQRVEDKLGNHEVRIVDLEDWRERKGVA